MTENERMEEARQPENAATGLRVRYWLESRVKEAEGRQFSRCAPALGLEEMT